jgi:hypothetical protein
MANFHELGSLPDILVVDYGVGGGGCDGGFETSAEAHIVLIKCRLQLYSDGSYGIVF